MLTNDFPVKHKENANYGQGIVVGAQIIPIPDEKTGAINYQPFMLVLWENADSPSMHSNLELEHKVDIKDYMEALSGDDDDYEDDEEEEEEEEDVNQQLDSLADEIENDATYSVPVNSEDSNQLNL